MRRLRHDHFKVNKSFRNCLQSRLRRRENSVTRWPDCFFNIWSFTMMKFYPKANKKSQSGFTTLPNIN